jgi:hypothetical protein
MYDIFRYNMTESHVQEIKFPDLILASFIKEVGCKHGVIITLSDLYARVQKWGNEIILVRIMKLRVFEMLKVILGSKEQEVRFKSSEMLCDTSCLSSHLCLEGCRTS